MGASRSLLNDSAISNVLCTYSMGDGSISIKKPTTALAIVVLPIWLLDMTVTSSVMGSLIASMMPT